MRWAFHALCGLTLCCAALAFLLQCLFYLRLQRYHQATWQALGRPSLLDGPFESGAPAFRFVWRHEYLSLSDIRTVRLAATFRQSLVLLIGLFACSVVFFPLTIFD